MKASELIKDLEEAIKNYGDLDVAVYADHGQDQMLCHGAGYQTLENNEDVGVIEIYGDGYFD